MIAGTLQRRRELTLRTWLAALNPVVDPRVNGEVLRFDNAAASAGVAEFASEYEVTWFTYDNESGVRTPVGKPVVHSTPALTIPQQTLGEADYAGVEVKTLNANYPSWARPVRFYIRRGSDGWAAVGVERSEAPAGRDRYASK